MNEHLLSVMAELGAQRALLVRLHAHLLLHEPDPLATVASLRKSLADNPTQPPARDGIQLDPAMSDLLASMTDDKLDQIMTEIGATLAGRATA